jgi:hypothetical protein
MRQNLVASNRRKRFSPDKNRGQTHVCTTLAPPAKSRAHRQLQRKIAIALPTLAAGAFSPTRS